MNNPVSLDNFYQQYAAGILSRKELEGLIFKSIQNKPRQFGLHHWQKYEFDEYLSWLYPRISNAINGYRDHGLSFDNYVGGLVRIAVKEFRSRRADRYMTEHAAWTAWYSYEFLQETEPEYSDDENPAKVPAGQSNNPRQILILVLKCYRYISDDFLERIAPLTGISIDILKKTIDQIRETRIERDIKIGQMRERVYAQFYRCIVYEKKLTTMPKNSAAYTRMKMRLEKARQRLVKMRQRLAGARPNPSNAQIAEILGVTKGTIDSSLHALRNWWNNVPNKPILN